MNSSEHIEHDKNYPKVKIDTRYLILKRIFISRKASGKSIILIGIVS